MHVGLALDHAVVLAFDVAAAEIGGHLHDVLQRFLLAAGKAGFQVLVIAEFFQRGDHRLFGGGVLRRQLGGSSIGLGLNEIRLQQVGHRRSLVLGRLGVLIPQFFDPDARHV